MQHCNFQEAIQTVLCHCITHFKPPDCDRQLQYALIAASANNDDLHCTTQVVCYTKPLVPGLWKTLLKLLSSNLFPAKATLIAAMARCEGDTWQPKGLVQGGPSALQPYLGQLIGQPLSAKSNRLVQLPMLPYNFPILKGNTLSKECLLDLLLLTQNSKVCTMLGFGQWSWSATECAQYLLLVCFVSVVQSRTWNYEGVSLISDMKAQQVKHHIHLAAYTCKMRFINLLSLVNVASCLSKHICIAQQILCPDLVFEVRLGRLKSSFPFTVLQNCSSGLVAALSSPDWPVKRAAAEALKALVIALGPGLDSPGQAALPAGVQAASSRAADALEKCRFDKVRPVRDAVQEAQAVLLDLQVTHAHVICR